MRAKQRLSAIDVFAGCGGLSLGLSRAGFVIKAAVEKDPVAAETYRANHRRTKVLVKDVREVAPEELFRDELDLVAGCAPCQGFCSLTSKYAREDERNGLLLEMSRLIESLRPWAVFMENVPGVLTRGMAVLQEFRDRLRQLGYYEQSAVLQFADYGIPQRRRRFVLVAGRGFVVPLPTPTHARLPDQARAPWVTVREAIRGLGAPEKLPRAVQKGGPRAFNWHVVRALRPVTSKRLAAAMPGKTWLSVEESIRPKCHRGDYRGFTNVYGRMAWDAPSPTITSGCTTPAKGRFGHPDRRRTTISVREAAILQTFPPEYRFETDFMECVTEMVGNAVPPLFAEVMGREMRRAILEHKAALGLR